MPNIGLTYMLDITTLLNEGASRKICRTKWKEKTFGKRHRKVIEWKETAIYDFTNYSKIFNHGTK